MSYTLVILIGKVERDFTPEGYHRRYSYGRTVTKKLGTQVQNEKPFAYNSRSGKKGGRK